MTLQRKPPPFNLDPHVVIRDPNSLPILLRRGIYDVITKQATSGDPTYKEFIAAFNIIAWSLTTAGRRPGKQSKGSQRGRGRLKRGTTRLTPNIGTKLNEERKRLTDTKKKIWWVSRWAKQLREQDPDRATMTYEEYSKRGGRSAT